MSPLVRKIFLHFMPKLLIMRRTTYTLPEYDDTLPPRGYTSEMEMQLHTLLLIISQFFALLLF